ncbi:MAG: hypothetical protein J7598_00725 [Mitsuaria chitosanitabida]|uniref:hypothetical protein n=1 Tax=Roseateles chitosanitabidus TaxID=65048 RepID=UPI001B0A869B|nr:hypothetical protein [Roseateles chitosanitabidus]MBO9685108.1 hypothetical protein [Roseateles chitosanitabidus]
MKLHRIVVITLMSVLGLFSNRSNATPETDFWSWFQKNQAALFDFERDQERTFDRLAAEMHKVDPNLTFEFGPKDGGRREFVISADGIRDAFPKVEALFAAAPSLPKWTFIKFRPRRDPFDLQYGGVSVKASSISVMLERDGQKVGLTVVIPGYTLASRKTYAGIAILLLDQALGEYDVETRVGSIDVRAPSAATASAVPLSRLPTAFDSFFVTR